MSTIPTTTRMARVREVVQLCLEVQGECIEPPDVIGVQKLTVA